jgi:hypothetical protein
VMPLASSQSSLRVGHPAVRPGEAVDRPLTFKPGHLGRGGELLLLGRRDKLCSECHKPFVSATANQKTCTPECSEAREKRMKKASRTRERVNRNLPKPKRGRPPKALLVERKPPMRSTLPNEAKTKCR